MRTSYLVTSGLVVADISRSGWDGTAHVQLTPVTPTSPVKAAALWELDWGNLLPVVRDDMYYAKTCL